MTPRGPQVPSVDPRRAHQLREEQGALVVDVREPSEWHEARIPGATHIPLGELPGRLEELPEDRPVILQCHSGSRSAAACAHLLQNGWEQAYNLDGGILAWQRAGLPLET